MLENGGAEVRRATSVADGLLAMRAWHPGVLISDIEMPGEDGYAFVRKIRADADAKLAYDVYIHRLRKYIGSYLALLGRTDVITFTAGVGENNALLRRRVLAGLEHLGIEIDPDRNELHSKEARRISTDASRVAVLVIPTDEELEIARQSAAVAL